MKRRSLRTSSSSKLAQSLAVDRGSAAALPEAPSMSSISYVGIGAKKAQPSSSEADASPLSSDRSLSEGETSLTESEGAPQ